MQAIRPRTFALVPCAGVGERAGAGGPKQYALLAGRAVVAHTLAALDAVPELTATLVVLAPADTAFEAHAPAFQGERAWLARCGGATRAASVRAGLRVLRERGAHDLDWVLVHDAARCLLRPAWVQRLLQACAADAVGGLLAFPLADTLKQAQQGRVATTVAREHKWLAQTPQMFRLALLEQALDAALAAGLAVTDEASAMEAFGLQPLLVAGDYENFKLTWPADFVLAGRLLQTRLLDSRLLETDVTAAPTPPAPAWRIGEGWDTHALVLGRPLVLGGVTVPHSHGLLGHSDADALAHAITDALLGAAGLGDIGQHFPDTDARFAGADSMVLLAEALRRVREHGYLLANVDSTVVAQAPKLAPFIPAMRERLAAVLGLAVEAVNVKAKTAEKMGPVGEGRAIEARAVCLCVRAGT
jgi:2-C-methyl-D-erythritol 4-phosphate cytidylyltransferase / 2-C-methyl-D-erythritol 2,4-cyclodiphosphate synthase